MKSAQHGSESRRSPTSPRYGLDYNTLARSAARIQHSCAVLLHLAALRLTTTEVSCGRNGQPVQCLLGSLQAVLLQGRPWGTLHLSEVEALRCLRRLDLLACANHNSTPGIVLSRRHELSTRAWHPLRWIRKPDVHHMCKSCGHIQSIGNSKLHLPLLLLPGRMNVPKMSTIGGALLLLVLWTPTTAVAATEVVSLSSRKPPCWFCFAALERCAGLLRQQYLRSFELVTLLSAEFLAATMPDVLPDSHPLMRMAFLIVCLVVIPAFLGKQFLTVRHMSQKAVADNEQLQQLIDDLTIRNQTQQQQINRLTADFLAQKQQTKHPTADNHIQQQQIEHLIAGFSKQTTTAGK